MSRLAPGFGFGIRHLAGVATLAVAWPLAALAGSLDTAAAPQLLNGQGPGPGPGYLLQLAGGLVVVLLGIFALAWIMRRVTRFQSAAGERMRVLGALSVGARERVVLVQVGEEQILVGVAAGQVRKLHVLSEPLPEPVPRAGARPGIGPNFAERLGQALRRAGGR